MKVDFSTPLVETVARLRARQRHAIRAAFLLVLALLLVCTVEAYRIQRISSAEALEIYHRHVKQDNAVYGLRRTLWLGGHAARDFLLNPNKDRVERFERQIQDYRQRTQALISQLEALEDRKGDIEDLRSKMDEFWSLLASVPVTTASLTPAERYDYVQKEIAVRRNSAGDLVREVAQVNQQALQDAEGGFAETRQHSARRLQWVLGLSLVFALAAVLISLRYTDGLERSTERQYKEVREAKVELQYLTKRLLELQEEERTRLSRELHDEIGQALATLRLEILRADSECVEHLPQVRERLLRARDLAERTVQSVRTISALLRPSLLDDLGLEAALDWLVEDFSRRTGMPCDLSLQDSGEPLQDSVSTCVFRVVQESLHNCEKHAEATEASVSLVVRNDELTVEIKDNGKGFSNDGGPQPLTRPRLGLIGMRERALVLGGSIDVESAPGRGTTIRLHIPEPGAPRDVVTIAEVAG